MLNMPLTPEMVRVRSVIRNRLPTLERIFAITRQPGFSIGVLHNGEEIFKHNYGIMDIDTGQKPTSDTLYCIASLTKSFVAAAIDLLVQRGRFDWDTPVASILTNYVRADGDQMLAGMTLRDICSHRTGLLGLDEIIQGMDGRILVSKSSVIDVVNALPRKSQFRSSYKYNNALYELAGCVIEQVAECKTWGDFLDREFFRPLDMKRSTSVRSVHQTDGDVAKGYMTLTNGSLHEVPPTELSEDSMNGGSGGIRSSVNDLLKWCKCLLESFRGNGTSDSSPIRPFSPLFDRSTMANPKSAQDGDYCSGWCYHQIPSKLGLISPNRDLESPLLGTQSNSIVVYGHQGDVPGYTCSLYMIPDTQSALVILSNGTGHSDATDWAAQDLIQAIYRLQPIADFVQIATHSAELFLSYYKLNFLVPLQQHRKLDTPRPSTDSLVGEYMMKNLSAATLTFKALPESAASETMVMRINRCEDQEYAVWHYHHDVWCYLPQSYDHYLKRALYRENWESFLISFHRDSQGRVCSLSWDLGGVEVIFFRETSSLCVEG